MNCLAPSSHKLWSSVSNTFIERYEYEYQYNLPISILDADFEALCNAILKHNDITVGDYRIKPLREDIITDGYGVDGFGSVWGMSHRGGEFVEFDISDEWIMARDVFTDEKC